MGNIEFALNLLLAGVIIVFFVLILLIIIITIYGKIIQAAQNRSKKKNTEKAGQDTKKPGAATAGASPKSAPASDGTVPGEVIAVIAAAVYTLYGNKPVKIRFVRRAGGSGSAWRNAGLLENTKPF